MIFGLRKDWSFVYSHILREENQCGVDMLTKMKANIWKSCIVMYDSPRRWARALLACCKWSLF